MKAEEIAKAIVGLTLRLVGLVGIIELLLHWVRLWHKTGFPHRYDPLKFIIELLFLALCVYLVRGGPLVMKYVYPDKKTDAPDDPAKGK